MGLRDQNNAKKIGINGSRIYHVTTLYIMSEKQHKIDKFANYQNRIVRTSPALDRHVFVPSQSRSQGPRSFWSATVIGTYKVPVGRHYRNRI